MHGKPFSLDTGESSWQREVGQADWGSYALWGKALGKFPHASEQWVTQESRTAFFQVDIKEIGSDLAQIRAVMFLVPEIEHIPTSFHPLIFLSIYHHPLIYLLSKLNFCCCDEHFDLIHTVRSWGGALGYPCVHVPMATSHAFRKILGIMQCEVVFQFISVSGVGARRAQGTGNSGEQSTSPGINASSGLCTTPGTHAPL